MTEDLDIIAISPETVFISGTSLTEQDALNAVDNVLADLEETNDTQNVDVAVGTLIGIQKIAGKSLAKLLYGYKNWWTTHNPTKNFEDHLDSKFKMSRTHIDRCLTVWDCVATGIIPEDVAVRPMRELVPIAKTISHGHTINRKQWDKIVKATGLNEIGDILRGIKGKAPRKSSLRIEWNRKGDLVAWKENKRVFIGFLDKEAYETNEIAKQAIDRLLDSAGVAKK